MFGYNRSAGLPSGVRGDGNDPGGLIIDGRLMIAYAGNAPLLIDEFGNINDATIVQGAIGSIPLKVQNSSLQTQAYVDSSGVFHVAGNTIGGGTLAQTGTIGEHGASPPANPPTITGSRAAMGVATYAIIQALAARGTIIDGTSA